MPIARRVALAALALSVPLLAALLFAGGGRAQAAGGGSGAETIAVTVASSTPNGTTTATATTAAGGGGTGSGPGGLVFTGAYVLWPGLAGLGLVAAGTLFALASRRRRRLHG